MNTSLTKGLAAFFLLAVSVAMAAPEPADPNRQSPWRLYVDAKEAYQMKQQLGDRMLFVDVRDPIEIMFTGFTDTVDVNVPFELANRERWNSKKPVYLMEQNPSFAEQIEQALTARGLGKDAPVVLMCRSGGARGAPSAKALWGRGFERVYVVTDGFEGRPLKEGERKNWRLKDGWKNVGLPWSYELNAEKMYLPASN